MVYISYISFVVTSSSVSGTLNMINVDMNFGSRRKYIFPLFHFSDDKIGAISGLVFIQHSAIVADGYTKIDQDLNEGAGGTYNYLCYTKNGKNKMTAIDIGVRA